MLKDYLIVHKDVLPDVFEKVVQVKKMMEQGEEIQVSDAVKKVGLSRSTYYKYKDHVFSSSENMKERRAVISFMLSHEKGLLSEVLALITSLDAELGVDIAALKAELGTETKHETRITITASIVFNGPPEESEYNSREYRVKFYHRARAYRIYVDGEMVIGRFWEPMHYTQYSIDKNVY